MGFLHANGVKYNSPGQSANRGPRAGNPRGVVVARRLGITTYNKSVVLKGRNEFPLAQRIIPQYAHGRLALQLPRSWPNNRCRRLRSIRLMSFMLANLPKVICN